MAISLLDIKNKKKRIDEINTTVNPTVTVSNSTSPQQTISLADIRNGKTTISPVITEEDKEKITNAVNNASNKINNSLSDIFNNEENKKKEELIKLTEKNAKQKREEFEQSRENYQKALSEEYKKRGVSFSNPFQEFNDKVTFENRDKKTQPTLADSTDVQDALRSVEEERQQTENARLESNLADYQENVAKVENEDVNLWDKTGGNVVRGLADLGSFINPSDREYVDENGNKVYLPTYNELKQQKVSENYDTGIGKLLGDSAYNISKILGSTAINSVAPGVGTATYWGDMFTDNYTSAVNEGYDKGNALLYSAIGTGSEYLTGKFLGSATKGLTSGKTSNLSKAISGATSKLIKNPQIANIIGSAGSEATEEFIQEYIGNINRLAVLENSTNAKYYLDVFKDEDVLRDALYSAGVGAISGGVTNVADSLNRNTNNNTDILNNFKAQLEESKANTTNKTKIETFNKTINLVDDYLSSKNNADDNNLYNLSAYSTKEINNIESDKIKIATKKSDVIKFVNSIKNKATNTKIYMGKIGNKIANSIKSKTGIDVENYNLSFRSDTAKHIIKQHGNAETEAKRGQVAVTEEDFQKIPQIVSEFDNVYLSGKSQEGKPSLTFEKEIDNIYYVVNYVSDKHHNLEVQTMYKQKKNSATADSVPSPILTSETNSGTSSSKEDNIRIQNPKNISSLDIDNIAQIDRNVKNGTSSNNINMQDNEKNSNKTTLNENKQEDVLTIKQDDNNVTSETSNNSKGDGESRFYRNITERSEFLTQENRDKLSKEDYIKHYDTVSNEESMNKALDRLNEGGEAELNRWFAKGTDNKAFSNLQTTWDSTDVAEGWILLKRAQDNGDYDMMVEVAKKMREIGTKSGQAVQMYNLLARLTPEGMVKYATSELDEAWKIASKNKSKEWVDKYSEDFQLTPEETEYIVNQMQKVEKMPDGRAKTLEIAKVQKMLQDKLPPLKGQGIKSWMRISMLLNPKTQVRNVLGNAVIAPVNTVADTFAAIADRQIAKKTGVRTTGNTNIKNYAKGFKKGLVESYEDFKLGVNTRNIQGNRFEIGEGKSFNENHKGILSKPRNAISKGFNRLDSLLSFVLDAGDRGFYEASFVNSINNQMTLNKTNEVTQDMIDVATNEALSRTWQDNNNYTKFVLDIRRGMNKVSAKGYGLGDVLIPFAKTPANLTKAIVDYSPVGLLKTLASDARKLSNNIKTGTVTTEQQHRFVQNLGKATAGTMLYVAGMALAQAGITSGANDDDKDVSDFMKNTLGIQPYSIKIGNHTFTYDWAQPVAAPFAITADITRALNSDDVALKDAITTSLDSGFNILLEQSFLSGIQNVLNTSYGSTTENIIDEVLGLPARAVPTFVKQINDMIDPKTRMTFENGKQLESAKNQVKTKIPGLSDELPVKRDTLGREIEKYGGENNVFNIFFNPANISKGKVSESAKEIYDVYQATKDKTIMPRSAPNDLSMTITNKKGEKKKKELSLDNKDKSEFLKISGGIIDDNVKKLKDNKYYKKLDDDEKALVIKEIVDYSYNKAKADLLDIDMSEVSGYKTVTKKLKGGMALYDYYAQEIYKNR